MRRWKAATLLGVATTLGVAWLLAVAVPVPMYPRRVARAWLGGDGRAWSSHEVGRIGVRDAWWYDLADDDADLPPAEAVEVMRARNVKLEAERRDGDMWFRIREPPPSWGTLARGRVGPESMIGSDTSYGWPLPCLWYSIHGDLAGNTIVNERLIGGLPVIGVPTSRVRDFRALPLRPLWPGLALNAAAWSAVWLVLLTAPGAIRRRRRRARGLCEHCGYDLAGCTGPACPECGVAWRRFGL
ncbi:MAG TPA: hypothetical protein PLU35_03505 [Phycisphaerales bacterium]|nr:hypothetical protein [Phycisphaerales bacterium]